MQKKRILLVLCMIVFLSKTAFSDQLTATHSIELNDPVGDVQPDSENNPGKDVVHIRLHSDGESLQVTVVLKEDVSYYLAHHNAGAVITMQLDTDNDATTGGNVSLFAFDDDGTLSLKYKYGFEYAVNLIACVKYTSGAKGCTGGTASPIEGFFSGFSVEEYESENSSQRKPVHSVFDSPHTVITGKQIAMGLPYTEIGVTSGQNIRIVIQESDSPDDETSYFPDILFRLK